MNTKIKSLLAAAVAAVGLSVFGGGSYTLDGCNFTWEVTGVTITLNGSEIPDDFFDAVGNELSWLDNQISFLESQIEVKNQELNRLEGEIEQLEREIDWDNPGSVYDELQRKLSERDEIRSQIDSWQYDIPGWKEDKDKINDLIKSMNETCELILVNATKIGKNAFQGCNFTTVTFEGATPPTFGVKVFGDIAQTKVTKIYVPAGSGAAYKTANNFSIYASLIYEPPLVVNSVVCGDPWSTITVGYTLNCVDAETDYKVAFEVTANGVTKGTTNECAKGTLENGKAYSQVIDTAALFGAATPDTKAKVKVSLIAVKPNAN